MLINETRADFANRWANCWVKADPGTGDEDIFYLREIKDNYLFATNNGKTSAWPLNKFNIIQPYPTPGWKNLSNNIHNNHLYLCTVYPQRTQRKGFSFAQRNVKLGWGESTNKIFNLINQYENFNSELVSLHYPKPPLFKEGNNGLIKSLYSDYYYSWNKVEDFVLNEVDKYPQQWTFEGAITNKVAFMYINVPYKPLNQLLLFYDDFIVGIGVINKEKGRIDLNLHKECYWLMKELSELEIPV